uniref:Uncharacterized protein n=1 Tax=Anopheles farauti TaxID=69004 RepID=A0A182QB75_9DIPT
MLPPLFGSTLFGGRTEKPLLALSLESSEESRPSSINRQHPENVSYDEDEYYPFHRHQVRWLTANKRFYDMVLGVLHVLERQARQEVQRAREQQKPERSIAGTNKDEQPA